MAFNPIHVLPPVQTLITVSRVLATRESEKVKVGSSKSSARPLHWVSCPVYRLVADNSLLLSSLFLSSLHLISASSVALVIGRTITDSSHGRDTGYGGALRRESFILTCQSPMRRAKDTLQRTGHFKGGQNVLEFPRSG